MKKMIFISVVLFVAIAGLQLAQPAQASKQVYGVDTQAENVQIWMINVARSEAGLKKLSRRTCMDTVSRRWSRTMARWDTIWHGGGFATSLQAECGYKWIKAGENVGVGPDSLPIFEAFYKSSGHKKNIMNPNYNVVGVGSWRNSKGKLFITQHFMQIR